MSRIRQEISSVQFQVDARKANASMDALQTKAKDLNKSIEQTKADIAALGNVSPNNKQLLEYQKILRGLTRDLNDVTRAQNDLVKGVKAADKLFKEAQAGTIENLSIKGIKAGQRGLQQRMQGLNPKSGKDAEEYRAYKAVLEESEIVIKRFQADTNQLITTIKNGGGVAKSTLTQAKSDLEQLLTLEVRGSAEWNTYNKQLKVVQGELNKIAEAERKAAQADQTAIMSKRMKNLKTLSSEALAETKRYWEGMIAGAEKGSAEMAKYEANLKKVVIQERQRKGAGAEQVLGNMKGYGIEQVRQATQEMERLRDSVVKGSRDWLHWSKMANEGNAYLAKFDEEAKIARGDAMSLSDALKLSSTAGGKGFQGTATQLQQAEEALQKAAAAAKKGSPEWIKYQEALEKVRVEMQNTGMTSERMHKIMDDPTAARNLNELRDAVKRAKAELALMEGTVDKNSKEYQEFAESTKKAEFRLKELESQSHGTASSFEKAWSRLKTYIGLYVGAAVAMQKIVATMGDLMELSDKMGEVRKTTGWSADEVGRLSDNLRKMDVRTSLVQLLDLSAAAGQLGLKTQEAVEGFTKSANMLMVALPEMGREAATSLMKIADATGDLKKNGGDVEETLQRVGSTIIALRANSASAAPAITDFVSRVGAVGAQSGISIDQIAALGSTIDALGGRVEMSATALSRMIPAIRNNSFAVANSIGVTESYLRSLSAMDQMVLIFQKLRDSIKGINTETEEGQQQMADNIEAVLGKNAVMAEVMKDLNQQGARAGIVFGLLSQNVDKLKDQLGIASEAYSKNTALLNEFNNMNETTAAKWARLKNQFEEMFVSDTGQRWLGGIIDGLRSFVKWFAEDGPIAKGFKIIMWYLVALKIGIGSAFAGAGTALKKLGIAVMALANNFKIFTRTTETARIEWKKMDAAMKANIWGAVIAAIGALVYKIYDWIDATKQAAAEIGRFNQKLSDEKKALDDLFAPLSKSNLAQNERSKLISEINNKYSKYLGYMLSETTSAIQLAEAHALIAKRIREEAYEKRILDQENAVYEKHDEEISQRFGGLVSAVRRNAKTNTDVGSVADALKAFIDKNLGEVDNDFYLGNLRPSNESVGKFMARFENYLERLANDGKINRDGIKEIKGLGKQYLNAAKAQAVDLEKATQATRADLRNTQNSIKGDVNTNLNRLISNIQNFGAKTTSVSPASVVQPTPSILNQTWAQKIKTWNQGKGEGYNWKSGADIQATALFPKKPNIDKNDIEQVKRYVEYQDQLRAFLEANINIDKQKRQEAEMFLETEDEMKKLRALLPVGATGGTGGTGGGSNPYGDYNKVTSDYEEWDADALVARRKEMLERLRALGNGADVQAVLSKDGRFISEAVKNNIKTTKQAIEWYNKERLKIQEELHTRHLTNSGDWMDAGGNKGGKKKKFDESSYALAELERYYALRKQRIEDARIEENFSEAEFNRRMEILEQEHLKKRSDLRKSFTSEDAAFVAKLRKWWESVAELDEIEWNKVEDEWTKATARNIGHNNMMVEKDLAQMKAIVMKQMNAIEEILAQERPFDGITKNLQDNLIKMNLLFRDGEQSVDETAKRLSFLLGEAESAYSLTTDVLLQRMRENGMGSWADSIASDENADKLLQAMLAQLRTVYDKIQEAIKKEAAQIKKEVDIWWSDIATGEKQSRKDTFEKALSNLGLWEDGVKRANSLIGAGVASERVADKLAIKQMQIRLAMQATYYNKMRQIGEQRIAQLEAAGKKEDAEHLRKSLNLSLTQEQVKLDEQRVAIANKLEESQNRLYTQMHEYADLLYSSMQSLFEASNTGNAEFYNERAKLQLTGGDGSVKQYIVIDNAGTEDAEAHYEYLTEMEALERQHEIDQQNASAEAWRKVMDDVNAKINEMITDQMNAMLQDAAINDNTAATNANTEALIALTSSIGGGKDGDMPGIDTTFGSGLNLGDIMSGSDNGSDSAQGKKPTPSIEIGPLDRLDYDDYDTPSQGSGGSNPSYLYDWSGNSGSGDDWAAWRIEQNNAYTENAIENAGKRQEAETKADKKMAATAQSAFAKMTQAANLYGIAYQVMSNDNMTAAQKFGMIAVQAAGNAAITALTVNMSETAAQTASDTPSVFSKLWKQLGWGAIPVFALFTGLLGGLMGLAASAITKSKSQIAQATGVSASQGRLATGMLTYAEGNVNEFTDPGSLTPGRHYNVDAADGKSYRAKYMGTNPKTHITNGPEFHLAGEAGREAIIDAHTTRLMQMDDNGIWSAIQTLYNGGSLRHSSRRGRGVRAFASGNLEEFEAMDNEQGTMDNGMDIAAMTDALNRQTAVQEALLERLSSPIQATFNVYGKGGLVDSYDTGKKTVNRHGVKY